MICLEILHTTFTILLPPAIALIGCYRRRLLDPAISWGLYFLFFTAIFYVLLTLELWIYEIFFSEILPFHARKVLFLAAGQAFFCPFVVDFFQKHFHVMVEMNENK